MSENAAPPSTEEIPDLLRDALVQTAFAVMTAVTAAAARYELSLPLWRILAILRDREPRMSDLAAHLGLDRSTITGIVDRAVARGLMQKLADESDRRANRVALTDAGRALTLECLTQVDRELAPLIADLDADARQRLTAALAALLAATPTRVGADGNR